MARVVSGIALALACATFAASIHGADQSTASAAACSALEHEDLTDTIVLSAVEVPVQGDAAAFCRVKGYVLPAINFELHLPVTDWNGKFYMAGCGASCGRLDKTSTFLNGKARNYAAILTDTGHWGSSTNDVRWMESNPVAREDLQTRHLKEIPRVGKALTRAYYKKDIRYSYFNGCSGGGKQGLTAATLYPDEFDGILSGAPATDPGGMWAFYASLTTANRDSQGRPILDPAKLTLVRQSVAKTCGDDTGLVIDSSGCKFDPKSLQCPAGKDGSTCLTAGEVSVVASWYSPPRLKSSGKAIYPGGLAYGSEMFWGTPTAKPEQLFARQWEAAVQMLRYSLREDEFKPAIVPDVHVDIDSIVARTERLAVAQRSPTDLTKYRDRKGKLVMYIGTGDTMVSPGAVAAYYETARKSLAESAADTIQLFMVPGLAHCRNPPGSDTPGFNDTDFDPLTALEGWVERGVAPAQIVATKHDANGRSLRSLPLCPFPQHAEYVGRGPREQASSWQCRS